MAFACYFLLGRNSAYWQMNYWENETFKPEQFKLPLFVVNYIKSDHLTTTYF